MKKKQLKQRDNQKISRKQTKAKTSSIKYAYAWGQSFPLHAIAAGNKHYREFHSI